MPEFHKRIRPTNLCASGFSRSCTKQLNEQNVLILREYIKKNWVKTKKLNKAHSSYTLAVFISAKLGKEFSNGELIAAAIEEGVGYEESVVNAMFFADTDMKKPKL